MSLATTPATWVTGTVVTAAQLNTEVRDAFTSLQASWTTFLSNWTASTTNPTLGNGTLAGRYSQIGKTIFWSLTLTWGSTTAAGTGLYSFQLPFASRASIGFSPGSGAVFDSSASSELPRVAELTGASSYGMADTLGNRVAATVPFAWAVNDIISANGTYEAA
jgi:hypothetical protein